MGYDHNLGSRDIHGGCFFCFATDIGFIALRKSILTVIP